nr:glycosyltransferase family 2 protein [Daejeonella lutea]
MCTYNGERFLTEQLRSILEQTYPNLELVIVDDNSTDNTIQIINSFLPNPIIRFHRNEKNLGYAANFGNAIALCKGEYISLADQDDIWLPEKIEILVAGIRGLSGIYHNSAFMNDDGILTGIKLSDKVHFVSGKIPESLILYNYLAGHTLMINREVLTQALPIPKGIYHDWWLAFVCMNLKGLNYIEQPLVYYRIHESNQTVLEEQNRKFNKTDTKSVRRYKKLRKLAGSIQVLKIFGSAPFISPKLGKLIEQLIILERGRVGQFFSFELLTFLIRNISIYKSGHRGYLGKLNAMRKDSFGIYKCRQLS